MMRIHPKYDWKRLTPADGSHYFFGYYDRCPWNHDQTLHLVLKVAQATRLPVPGETAEVGVVDRGGHYQGLAETRAWCHQQGSMTLWLPHRPGCFIFNDYDVERRQLLARIYDLHRGLVGAYDRPVYAMSPDGRWGVSLNFGRIPRRGYSYAEASLSRDEHPDYDAEGLFLIDMHSGASRLLVSYRQMMALHPVPYELDDVYVWLNHAIFNCDSSRILWLFRHCHNPLAPAWKTHMFTVGVDGAELLCPLPHFYWNGMISHQIWGRTPREVLIDARWRTTNADYVVFDERQLPLRATLISKGMGPFGHTIFSPDGTWLLADTYSDENSNQHLALVNPADGSLEEIGLFRHYQPQGYCGDARCDLHPRWSRDGRTITVDSIHNYERGIYMLEL